MINIDEIYSETLDMRNKVSEHWKTLKLDDSLTQIRGLEDKMSSPEFWDDPDKANTVSKELSNLKKEYKEWESLRDKIKNLADFVEMIKNENDIPLRRCRNRIQKRVGRVFKKANGAPFSQQI